MEILGKICEKVIYVIGILIVLFLFTLSLFSTSQMDIDRKTYLVPDNPIEQLAFFVGCVVVMYCLKRLFGRIKTRINIRHNIYIYCVHVF